MTEMSTTNPDKEMMAVKPARLTAEALYAKLYHHTLPAWKGEFAFYRQLAQEMKAIGPVLEVACGTGRIAIDLAWQGMRVTGFDLSEEMLEIARQAGTGVQNLRWERADMRSFDMGEHFGLVIIPGHSFQFMLTPADQLACLSSLKRHLLPGGKLVIHNDHQDLAWLGTLGSADGGQFKQGSTLPHPVSGNPVNVFRKWSYQPSTQTAFSRTLWEERDPQGGLLDRWERGPVGLHCIFRYEMEHLLYRAGFTVRALYGSFEYDPLHDDSTEMIWVSSLKGKI
jgi:SAM-dependent methyltransferase